MLLNLVGCVAGTSSYFIGDFTMIWIQDKSLLVQNESESYMWEQAGIVHQDRESSVFRQLLYLQASTAGSGFEEQNFIFTCIVIVS